MELGQEKTSDWSTERREDETRGSGGLTGPRRAGGGECAGSTQRSLGVGGFPKLTAAVATAVTKSG